MELKLKKVKEIKLHITKEILLSSIYYQKEFISFQMSLSTNILETITNEFYRTMSPEIYFRVKLYYMLCIN